MFYFPMHWSWTYYLAFWYVPFIILATAEEFCPLNTCITHGCFLLCIIVESESESRSVVSNSLQSHGLYSPWNSPGQNTGVGISSLLQGIFPTQGLNPGLPHCRRILYQWSYQGSPWHNCYYHLKDPLHPCHSQMQKKTVAASFNLWKHI